MKNFSLDKFLNTTQKNINRTLTNQDFLSDISLETGIFDNVDGRIVLESRLSISADEKYLVSPNLRNAKSLSFQITQGQAVIQTDPYNGKTIIIPKGITPIRIRPTLEASLGNETVVLAGEEHEIGIDTRAVPMNERYFDTAGGGACAARWSIAGEVVDFELRVRAFMPANVVPLALDRRLINWKHALYFGHHPKLGLMRIRYNPTLQSKTLLTSLSTKKQERGAAFFPAKGQNDLYFIIEMLDLGLSCFNKTPMIQKYKHTEWPPYSTLLTIDRPVDFFDTENPSNVMISIHKNDMQIYDYSSIEVECLQSGISKNGVLNSRWLFKNQSKEQITARWFALGNFEPDGKFPDQGNRLLGPAKSAMGEFEVEFNAKVKKSSLPQFVTMNIVSLSDPVLMGNSRLDFRYPETNPTNPE